MKAENPIDVGAYCGCTGSDFTRWCQFCPDGTSNLFKDVTIPSLNFMTCGDVENYAAFITDPDTCDRMGHLSSLCCGTLDEFWQQSPSRAHAVRTHQSTDWEQALSSRDDEEYP